MKRIAFERPTNHYDERVKAIDLQLCELIKLRYEISKNNPGFPPLEYISNWAKEFNLYEDLLKSLFGSLWNGEQYRPIVEPSGFRLYMPVLKSIEKENRLFSVTFISQYTNSSVVNLNIDWDTTNDSLGERPRNSIFELFLGDEYNCRMLSGGGSDGHLSYNFVVSPSLPDSISGLDLIFRGYNPPFRDISNGLEIIIQL